MRLFVTCTLLLLVALGGAYAGFQTGLSKLGALTASSKQSDAALNARLADVEAALLLLAQDTANLRAGQQTYIEQESVEKQALADALNKLDATVTAQDDTLSELSKVSDVSGLISTWSPFVYDITCELKNGSAAAKGSGSATLEWQGGTVRFITNRHVLAIDGFELQSCTLAKPSSDVEFEVPADRITVAEDLDVAYGVLAESPVAMYPSDRCAGTPTIGDTVVILGYPQIGARESITATEGIISGFDKEYYTTSAKIERGNSGGAAIDVKRGCFLGLPTLVFAGKIESLARILPVASL